LLRYTFTNMKRQSMFILLIATTIAGCAAAAEPKPSNHVAVLLDTSGSYRSRIPDATKRVANLLDDMAKQEVHRWDNNTDQIVLISLDASPAVIWEGTLAELKGIDRPAWEERIKGRSDFASCTDVDGAFALAADRLQGDQRDTHKYVFAFTDMQHEAPTTSLSTCAAPTLGPSDQFPWDRLQDISVSVFWMPPRQILPWKRASSEQGLAASFRLYSDSESASVTIAPPPRPKHIASDDEKTAQKDRIIAGLKSTLIGFAVVAAMMILFALYLGKHETRRRPVASPRPPASGAQRASSRPVAAATRRI